MRKTCATIGIALAISMLGLVSSISSQAATNYPCVEYSITAPMAGTQSDTKCAPTPLPSQFDMQIDDDECHGSPMVGVDVCVGATIYLVSP